MVSVVNMTFNVSQIFFSISEKNVLIMKHFLFNLFLILDSTVAAIADQVQEMTVEPKVCFQAFFFSFFFLSKN